MHNTPCLMFKSSGNLVPKLSIHFGSLSWGTRHSYRVVALFIMQPRTKPPMRPPMAA